MSRVPAGAAAWLLLAAAGCGVGRYDEDYAKAVERHREGAPFLPPKPAQDDSDGAAEPGAAEDPAPEAAKPAS